MTPPVSDFEEFQQKMKVCAENLVSSFVCLGRAFTKVMINVQQSFLVNRRTRKATLAGRYEAARWYATEHKRRATKARE